MEGGRPEPGEVLAGKLRVERLLGQGGMGYVLQAMHMHLDRRVAVKLLLPQIAANAQAVTRFMREARAAASITSEHVVRVLDVSALDDGTPMLVMEYLDGQNLGELVRSRGPLPVEDAVDYVLQASEALAEAHAAGMVHRDLKPENLFLTRRADGSPLVKVLDFGISKLRPREGTSGDARTGTSALMGSPLYMSPEQLESARDVDARSDQWALGVVLFELVAGAPPFDGETLPQVVAAIMGRAAPRLRERRPDAPVLLDAVVARCLSKPPGDRYPSIAAMARALAGVAPQRSQGSIQRIERILGAHAGAPELTGPGYLGAADGDKPQLAATNATFGGTLAIPKRRTALWAALGGAGVVVAAAAVIAWATLGRPGAAPQASVAQPPPPVAASSTLASAPGNPTATATGAASTASAAQSSTAAPSVSTAVASSRVIPPRPSATAVVPPPADNRKYGGMN
jgi:tRNA A-37 threonylcarbamoyl transferase component Bud32